MKSEKVENVMKKLLQTFKIKKNILHVYEI